MDVMEDLMDDFGEMIDEQFPQQQKTRERIKSTNNLDLVAEGYEGKSDKTVYKSRAARRQTEGNLTFGNNFLTAEPAKVEKIYEDSLDSITFNLSENSTIDKKVYLRE